MDNGNASWGIAPSAEEMQASLYRHTIATTQAEKEELSAQLKKSRRESQKMEAGLKGEMDALKRAMEKTVLQDQRARQKSLALQEQVKQAYAGAEEAEKDYKTITDGMEKWQNDEVEVKTEWDDMVILRDMAREENEAAGMTDVKILADLDGRLASIEAKYEKHKAKRDKLAKENEELRQKLEDIASAQREVEKRNEAVRQQRLMAEDYAGPSMLNLRQMLGREDGRVPGSGSWEHETNWQGSSAGIKLPVGLGSSSQLGNHMMSSMGGMPDAYNGGRSRQGSLFNPRLPPTTTHPRAATMGSANTAVAAISTQGIPLGASSGISHLGNPTGFFPNGSGDAASLAASTSMGNRGFRASSGRDGPTISPMMANVTAAPFMPSNVLSMGSNPSPTLANTDHHTSLVPPQLQHRIYLPRGRSNVGGGSQQAGDESTMPAGGPAFPPLPSHNATSALLANRQGQTPSVPGPSLASIVTRAIIPGNMGSLAQAHQPHQSHQPSRQGSGESPLPSGIPSPPIQRPLSWQGLARTNSSDLSGWPNTGNTLSPASEEFPPLSPVQLNHPDQSSPGIRQNVSQAHLGSQSGSWGRQAQGQGPSRRSSLLVKEGSDSR